MDAAPLLHHSRRKLLLSTTFSTTVYSILFACVSSVFFGLPSVPLFAQGSLADHDRAKAVAKNAETKILRTKVDPHWSKDGESFWYANILEAGQKEFVSVNALSGERKVLNQAPAEASKIQLLAPIPKQHASIGGGEKVNVVFANETAAEVRLFWINLRGEKKPYGTIPPGSSQSVATFQNHVWKAEDTVGKLLGIWEATDLDAKVLIDGKPATEVDTDTTSRSAKNESVPKAFIRNHNVWLRIPNTGEEFQLSSTGTPADTFVGKPKLSPDNKHLFVIQEIPQQEHKVTLVEAAPKDQLQPKLLTYNYLKAGDKIAHPRPRLFDIETRKEIPIAEDLFQNPWSLSHFEWAPDSSRFQFLSNERGHQMLRLLSVDALTGTVRTILEEKSATFVDYSQKTFLHSLPSAHELIWMSERDGWNHLWLIDVDSGTVKNQITRGNWVVRSVDHVDEEKRQIWFTCAGVYPSQDPYYLHLARVNFDGSGFVVLTKEEGTHVFKVRENGKTGVLFSPDKRWFLDSYSRVDLPPITELRRSADGALVCVLERGDASKLKATGWLPPEQFHAKGRDGNTDIYGVIFRPTNFDPNLKYPVLEHIYAGPHGFSVPKAWTPTSRMQSLAELGFMVVQIDGMGTNWRSKSFHDVCWKNLKDGGFPDRIAWIKAAAERFPQMDITRVGIYGGSAGGQNALAALLHYGDFYKAAAADCGCHDNRMDKIWWNEAWMGWPVGPEYADNSNVTHAAKLRGKLLLTVGEIDHNVDPASTMQVVNALIAADKDFELLIVPGADHGAGESPYAARRRQDFFVRHLLGVEPRWNQSEHKPN